MPCTFILVLWLQLGLWLDDYNDDYMINNHIKKCLIKLGN